MRAGYRSSGPPATLSVVAHHAQLAVAPHRAEAAEAGGDRGAGGGDRAAGRRRRPRRDRSPRCAPSWSASSAACGWSRSSIRSTCATGASSQVPQAGRAGGDVLPDGRLRLDERAHEGPRQALLLAALPVPEAPLQARRGRLHPPHARGEGGGRGDLLPLAARPAARWSRRRWRRWPRIVQRPLSGRRSGTSTRAQASRRRQPAEGQRQTPSRC